MFERLMPVRAIEISLDVFGRLLDGHMAKQCSEEGCFERATGETAAGSSDEVSSLSYCTSGQGPGQFGGLIVAPSGVVLGEAVVPGLSGRRRLRANTKADIDRAPIGRVLPISVPEPPSGVSEVETDDGQRVEPREEGYLRISEIVGDEPFAPCLVPVSRTTIWDWVKKGKFPAPVKLGPNTTAWRRWEVLQWSKNRREARGLA